MAITYPLSTPASPKTNGVKLIATNIVGTSRSVFTAQTQTMLWPGEFWSLEVSLPPMPRAKAEPWLSFLVALRGASGTFLYGDPAATVPQGVATGTPLVNGTNNAGSTTLVTKGWTNGTTGILKAGDYFQIGTGLTQRLYKVLTDTNSDGSGNATFDLFPRLRETLSDGTTIVLSSPKGCFRLAVNQTEWSEDTAAIYGLQFKCIEAI